MASNASDHPEAKITILGPFEVPLDYDQLVTEGFNPLISRGRFDRANRKDINPHNFPIPIVLRGRSVKNVFLVNVGRPLPNDQVPADLAELGYRSVRPEWVLALNAGYPYLMDDHIIITAQTPWIGREDAPEVICLHKDNGKRRLRTHYADTIWGPHIWFAVEVINQQ
jgi:hypothetical protein